MVKRGRKSAGDLTVIRFEHPRVVAPEWLSSEERDFFTKLVDSTVPQHFAESDVPILASYVQTCLLARKAAKQAEKWPESVPTFDKLARLQATLATKLRLSPQSRTDPKTLSRSMLNQPSEGMTKPWEFE